MRDAGGGLPRPPAAKSPAQRFSGVAKKWGAGSAPMKYPVHPTPGIVLTTHIIDRITIISTRVSIAAGAVRARNMLITTQNRNPKITAIGKLDLTTEPRRRSSIMLA